MISNDLPAAALLATCPGKVAGRWATAGSMAGAAAPPHCKATGFFRLEQANRWWLVTPEGNAFLSFGINHVQPDRTAAPYNREFWPKG